MKKTVTVSAKIDVKLRRKMTELGIKPSEAIRRALEREVKGRTRELLQRRVEEAGAILSKVGKEEWVKAVREGREGR